MTQEMGKPITESRGEVKYAAGFVEWYAEEAKRAYGDIVPSHAANKRLFAMRQPVGPVYAVTPWNFPAAMVTRKVAPALAAGCTVVLKPAEQSPLTAIRLDELWVQAGGPAGCVPGADDVGSRGGVGRVLRRRARAQADLHGQHRGGHQVVRAGRAHGEARVARARRPRAVHRLRGRRHSGGGAAGDGVEVPQCRPDLRVRQSHLRARPGSGGVRRSAWPRACAVCASATR